MVSNQELNPLISVIVPCYNQSDFIAVALNSILEQDYKNWECIIVNDGSTDETKNVAKDFLVKDERIKYYEKINGGLSSARNFGLKKASGTWIQFLDSDDYIVSDKFSSSVDEIIKSRTIDLVISNFKLFKERVEETILPYAPLKADYFNFESLLFGWNEEFIIPIHSGLFNKSFFETYSFNESLKANEDWIMWLNFFCSKRKIVYLNDTFALYRINPKSMTKDSFFVHDCLVIAYKHILDFIPSNYTVRFAQVVIDRLNSSIKTRENRITILETTFKNKMIWKLKHLFYSR